MIAQTTLEWQAIAQNVDGSVLFCSLSSFRLRAHIELRYVGLHAQQKSQIQLRATSPRLTLLHFPIFTTLSINSTPLPPPTHTFRRLHSMNTDDFLSDVLSSPPLITSPAGSLDFLLSSSSPSSRSQFASSLTRSLQSFTLNSRRGSTANHFLHRPFPFLPDWFHGLSDNLVFLFCSTAGFICMVC